MLVILTKKFYFNKIILIYGIHLISPTNIWIPQFLVLLSKCVFSYIPLRLVLISFKRIIIWDCVELYMSKIILRNMIWSEWTVNSISKPETDRICLEKPWKTHCSFKSAFNILIKELEQDLLKVWSLFLISVSDNLIDSMKRQSPQCIAAKA